MRASAGDTDFLVTSDANNLTALRLVAALCVVASHCALLRAGQESAKPLAGLTYFNLGDHALDLFFFVSGLTIAASLARTQSVMDFVVARVLRLWPALLVVTALTTLVAAPSLSDVSTDAYFRNPAWFVMLAKTSVLSGATGHLPGVFATNPLPDVVNGSPWTLRYEVLCYTILLVGSHAMRAVAPTLRVRWIPASIIAVALVMIAWPPGDVATTFDHLARFWLSFGLGAAAHHYRSALSHSSSVSVFAWAAAYFAASVGGRFECIGAIVFVGASTLLAARVPIGRLRRVTNRTDLSYGVYLTAWPITQTLVAKAPSLTGPMLVLVVSCLAMALAFLSWTLIEKPALGLRRGIVDRLQRDTVPKPRDLGRDSQTIGGMAT